VKEFKRLMSSEMISMKKAKGVVLLWAGLAEGEVEKKETRDEITRFMENDPLIVKDMIEDWNVIDLDKANEVNELPVQAGK
jgi:hypothetical protein